MSPFARPSGCALESCLIGSALDGMCVGLVLTNAAGRIEWMNRTARSTLVEPDEDPSGRPLSQVLRDPQLAALWHRALSSDDTVHGQVTAHVPRHMELKVNATTSTDGAGELIARVLLFCDVTRERTVQVNLSEAATLRLLDLAETWQEGTSSPIAGLTPAELKVLRLVGCGYGNQEIAERLDVASSTVRSHLKSVYRKTGLTGRSDAIHFAVQHGLC